MLFFALGVYLAYSILDFPDLSVDGTMPLGAIVSAVLILKGINPWISVVIAFASGAAAGCITGILHVKLKLQPLLFGNSCLYIAAYGKSCNNKGGYRRAVDCICFWKKNNIQQRSCKCFA